MNQRYHIGMDGKPHKCSARTAESCPLAKVGTVHGSLAEVMKAAEDRAAASGGSAKQALSKSTGSEPASSAGRKLDPVAVEAQREGYRRTRERTQDIVDDAINGAVVGTGAEEDGIWGRKHDYSGFVEGPQRPRGLQGVAMKSYDNLEAELGIPRGQLHNNDWRHAMRRLNDEWPAGALGYSDLYNDNAQASARIAAQVVLNARLQAMHEAGWELPSRASVDAEQERIWKSIPAADRKGLRKNDVRGLAIVQAGYGHGPGSIDKIGDVTDPSSLACQALAYAKRGRYMNQDGSPMTAANINAVKDLMYVSRRPESRDDSKNTRFNLRPDGVALWRISAVQDAMADGIDLRDDEQFSKMKPEAMLGVTKTMVKRFTASRESGLSMHIRRWIDDDPDLKS